MRHPHYPYNTIYDLSYRMKYNDPQNPNHSGLLWPSIRIGGEPQSDRNTLGS